MTFWMLMTSTTLAAVLPPSSTLPLSPPPEAIRTVPASHPGATVSAGTAMDVLRKWKEETESLRQGLAERSPAMVMKRLQTLQALDLSQDENSSALAPQATSLYQSIQEELTALESLFDQIKSWEENLRINKLRGHAGQTMMRAEAFSVERKYRRELQDRVQQTTDLLKQWALVHEFLLADQSRRLSRMMVLLSLEDAERAARRAGQRPATELESYEYFEVKTAGTVREISGLPEVYGDPQQWMALFQANRDQIPNPGQVLTPGTVLVVPQQKTTRAFDF